MATRTVTVEIEVDDLDDAYCSRHCLFNDESMYCNLFGEDLVDRRCPGCLLGEVKDV